MLSEIKFLWRQHFFRFLVNRSRLLAHCLGDTYLATYNRIIIWTSIINKNKQIKHFDYYCDQCNSVYNCVFYV